MRLALALLLFVQQERGKYPDQGKGPEVGKEAPDFTLKSLDGKSEVQLSKLRSRPVVLIFGSYT
ncbi:MAG: redoxin domain-containing protein [Planctomycetes bacterium]|nr:redoxin domain-containing protein [Planctomycetota bacterium]